ncbi:hypothetical protein T10_8519 [Trichinella papuae]|uniref:Uncharacterized protein n=1 Tax=Trichinella papuae TaxID=268474 RepID=A0A0V1MSK3_9BILA|nr:hypothetical protein T10_8519 [Trichinella papuae]
MNESNFSNQNYVDIPQHYDNFFALIGCCIFYFIGPNISIYEYVTLKLIIFLILHFIASQWSRMECNSNNSRESTKNNNINNSKEQPTTTIDNKVKDMDKVETTKRNT